MSLIQTVPRALRIDKVWYALSIMSLDCHHGSNLEGILGVPSILRPRPVSYIFGLCCEIHIRITVLLKIKSV